jgi:hypothetical protein
VSIAAELAHAYRMDQRIDDHTPWFSFVHSDGTAEMVEREELINHRDYENQIRIELEVPIRTTYSGMPLYVRSGETYSIPRTGTTQTP